MFNWVVSVCQKPGRQYTRNEEFCEEPYRKLRQNSSHQSAPAAICLCGFSALLSFLDFAGSSTLGLFLSLHVHHIQGSIKIVMLHQEALGHSFEEPCHGSRSNPIEVSVKGTLPKPSWAMCLCRMNADTLTGNRCGEAALVELQAQEQGAPSKKILQKSYSYGTYQSASRWIKSYERIIV